MRSSLSEEYHKHETLDLKADYSFLPNIFFTFNETFHIKWVHDVFFLTCPLFRTLPAKHTEKIAEQMQKHNINALLIIGGFEVCLF